MQLTGKRALVTGGSVRLGRSIGEALVREGCHLVIHYHQSRQAARELADKLSSASVQVTCVEGNLSDPQTCERIVEEVRNDGPLDILINNASVFHKVPLAEANHEALCRELNVNALAPMLMTRAFAAVFQDGPMGDDGRPLGKIVNLLDRRVVGQEKGMLPYLLSKKLLDAYTRIAALELGPRISVNAVAPGPVLPPPGQGESYLQDHAGPMVLARRPSPEDIAQAVMYLLKADAVTGQTLFVDSGQHLMS